MKAIKGKYRDGIIELQEQPTVEGEKEVMVIFPDDTKAPGREGIQPKDFYKLSGIFNLGGNAVKNSEALYD
jgi:hypothetical protein